MQYIKGTDRTQAVLFPQSLDEIIDLSNEVRIIDLFAESIDHAQFSFHVKSSLEGRPPYHPKDLLKLYVYGYLNSIRSSRSLEKECKRNIEVMWLLHQLDLCSVALRFHNTSSWLCIAIEGQEQILTCDKNCLQEHGCLIEMK